MNNKLNICVLCPGGVATGGPELLHQFCYYARKIYNVNSYMCYFPYGHNFKVHKEYKCYNNPIIDHVVDSEEWCVISSELLSSMNILNSLSASKKIIWFLSIDNYYNSRVHLYYGLYEKIILLLRRILFNEYSLSDSFKSNLFKKINLSSDPILKTVDLIMAQSYWVQDVLRKNKFHTLYLSDFINEEFFNICSDVKKQDIVLYNSKKGYSFTKKIISYNKDITFIKIDNLSRSDVIHLLRIAKVYIDFGNHPGKDRLPRESVLQGCCVVTNKKGSASDFRDIPIKSVYKINDESIFCLKKIRNILKYCINNYDIAQNDYFEYRNKVVLEKNKFIDDLKLILSEISLLFK